MRPDGKVTFPLIGDIDVTGKTVTEFTRQLEASLAEYLVRPQVSVNILKLGTTRVYVLGEVKKPGLYELEKSHRVLDALGKAEGFTEKAAKKKIFLIRKGAEEPVLVNINNFLKKSDQSQNYVLNEGDCLYLTSNGKINIVRDIMPFVNGAYMISEIKKITDLRRDKVEDEITIDLRELVHIVQKNARFIAKVTGGCIAVAGLYLLIASPVYESDSLLRIKQPKGIGSSLLESIPMGNSMANKQLMSTYAEILKSRSVIVPVIEQTEEADSDGKYMRYEDYIKNRIVTNPFKDTEILKVTVNANTPEGAQKANDLIVNSFLQRLTGLVREEQKTTRAFVEERVVASKAELEAAESALTEYKKASKILSPTNEMKLVADKMGIVDKLKAENKVALATAQARLSATDQQLGGEAKATADNAVIKQYNAKLAELETQRIDYLDKYTAKHPKVIETEDAIANLKSKLQQEIAKVASLQAPSDNPVHQQLLTSKFGSEAAISVAESNLAELERLDKRNQEDVERLSEKEQKYLSLMRDVSVADEIYIMLAKRLEEAKVAEVAVSTEVQVVDTATLPEDPVKPKKLLTLLLAAFLGIFGGSGFVIAKELMNRTIKTTDDVANYLDLPVLGSVPDYESLKKSINKEQRQESFADKVRRYSWKR